jgi:glycosyltransferase involved in cell wall biosynthesis
MDVVDEMESAIARSPSVHRSDGRRPVPLLLGRSLWELYRRRIWRPAALHGRPDPRRGEDYFAVLMGPRFRYCLPYFAFPVRKHVYLFDAWPDGYGQIAQFTAEFGVANLFVSSRQSALRIAAMCSPARVDWIPEAVDPSLYRCKPSEQRRIHVLQFGRKWDAYHHRILHALQEAGVVYLFEEVKGQVVFPSREHFISGLSDTKISVCFPSSVTHPERAGDICTLTTRYLQSMASKCLVVGTTPPEMLDLFGYAPVVEADLDDPAGQLLAILSRYDHYADLIEFNYETVCKNHTWQRRWQQIRARID